MPAKRQITREAIITAGFELVRESGMGALNMRDLAKRCNCSTQPIYLCFKNAEEVKAEIAKLIYRRYNEYLAAERESGRYPEYKAIGMGYIRFAKEEKELFKYMFMRDRSNESGKDENGFDEAVMMLMKNYGLYEDYARRLHAEMWVVVHGIGVMYATGYLDWDWETVSQMLTDFYRGLTNNGQGQNNDNRNRKS